ncbi:MAG: M48 family metallopeptidase [Candidatus Omnitrophica bacterium]|nr:M48 family metallopeptidase [Candidatus Omnitrophota bacterium]
MFSLDTDRVKRYSLSKYTLEILGVLYLIALLFIFMRSGLSENLSRCLLKFTTHDYLIRPLYFFVISAGYYFLSFPIHFTQSYILEHKFSLSRQSIRGWSTDEFKQLVLSYIIGLILIAAFYYILDRNPQTWWLIVSLFWVFFSLILAKVFPSLIIPLFFKYKKLSDEILKERIIKLAGQMKIGVLDCFEIDFSKKTLKANAAFVGFGKNKRVILADTLKDKYSYEEIEVILAHEFAHYRLRHLFKLVLVNTVVTLAVFYLIFKTAAPALSWLGLSSLSDIAALPAVIMYFVLSGIIMQPLENYISRRFERNADLMALKVTGLKEAFISMMDKLACQNLADRNPNFIIKFFFFDHPPIDERIRMANTRRL